ncbi:MAG: hypothetical protein OEY14_16635, partial [Myxococcales bacterium]|nr:hypothetical protein [Myxococcales bacterium]
MVARPEARSEISPDLHGALALQLAGRDEPALRLALGILEAARGPLEEAAYLVATLLARAGRPQEAARAVGPLVHAFTRCGDLPGATLAVH